MIELKPSKGMWEYFREDITPSMIAAIIADRVGGYYISHSATLLLNDLNFLTPKGNVTKKAKLVMASQIHNQYHHGGDGIKLIRDN
jgi:hypothetical protein